MADDMSWPIPQQAFTQVVRSGVSSRSGTGPTSTQGHRRDVGRVRSGQGLEDCLSTGFSRDLLPQLRPQKNSAAASMLNDVAKKKRKMNPMSQNSAPIMV